MRSESGRAGFFFVYRSGGRVGVSTPGIICGEARSGSQRIVEVLAAIAANLIRVAFKGEDAAQLGMVATEGKI
jgi:hypothetical protein